MESKQNLELIKTRSQITKLELLDEMEQEVGRVAPRRASTPQPTAQDLA